MQKIAYDPDFDVLTIDGVRYTGGFFRCIQRPPKAGPSAFFYHNNGRVVDIVEMPTWMVRIWRFTLAARRAARRIFSLCAV